MDTTPATKKQLVRIGSLYAYIPGDMRYSDRMDVHWDPNTDTVRVRVYGTGAVGGMDSGRSDSYEPACDWDRSTPEKPTAAQVVALVKQAIGNSRFLFQRYGKPSKRMSWAGAGEGLSAKLVKEALEVARQHVAQ